MAGILKVDQVQSDSNLAFNIAGSNVAFMNATSLQMVGSNVSLAGTNVITNGRVASTGMPIGSVLQTVQTVKTDTFSSSASSFTNITGLTATITPSSTSSRILVMASVVVAINTSYFLHIRLARDGSSILQGDAAGSRIRTQGMVYIFNQGGGGGNVQLTWPGYVVDSPASTSSLTYSVQMCQVDGSTHYVNRLARDDDASYEPRSASSLILMEIAG